MDLGGGRGFSTADQSRAASGVTGSVSSGFTGPSGGDGNNNDPYQGFVQASQPRGLSAIERAVQNKVQQTKNYLSQPVNKRGILGGLIGGALFGPLGLFFGKSLGQRFGGAAQNKITDFFGGGPSPYGDTIPFTNPRMDSQSKIPFTNPDTILTNEGGITELRTFPDILNLMAGLTKKQKELLDQRKNMLDVLGPEAILDTIKEDDDPNDPATLEDVKEYYGIV